MPRTEFVDERLFPFVLYPCRQGRRWPRGRMRGFAPAYGSPLNYESISFHRAESSWTHLNDGIQCNFEPINATPNSTEIPRVATKIREEPNFIRDIASHTAWFMERLVTTRSTGRTAALGQSLPAGKSAESTAWQASALSCTAISGKPTGTLDQTLHRNPRLHPGCTLIGDWIARPPKVG